ncbi:formylglycine-generating enzyme family protein [Magnetococcales bacterium HHB-1]
MDHPELFYEETTKMPFVRIKGGDFLMGDLFDNGFPDEKPVHKVTLDDFYLGKYPVTQGEWRLLMNSNPAMFKKGDRYPVEMVSWDQAKAFIYQLNQRSKIHFRLPSEAEWEYAARSGGKKELWSGTSDLEQLGRYAWYDQNAQGRTHPVGEKKPNGLGLHDMSGLLHEWTEDWYFTDAFNHHTEKNPLLLEPKGDYRAFRGGSWKRHPEGLRCTRRMGGLPHGGFGTYGFRLAISATEIHA